MKKIAIIAVTEKGLEKALIIQQEFPKSLVVTTLSSTNGNISTISSISNYLKDNFRCTLYLKAYPSFNVLG